MIALAEEAARQAGEVLRSHFGRSELGVKRKARADYVTDVDRRAEEVIRELLEREVPEHSLLLEESGASGSGSDYQWIVDPLDGTTNYLHRYGFFSVSIALRHRTNVILGVVYDPLRGEMFSAEAGEPARLNGVDIHCSDQASLDDALICTGFPFRSRDRIDAYLACFREVFLASGGMRRDGSAALDLAYVAAGRFDAFWELDLKPWDIAAGSLIVEQARGRVSDLRGGTSDLEQGWILASNGRIHEALVALTAKAFPAGPHGELSREEKALQ